MIQIMKFGQMPEEKIFARVVPEVNVEAVVSQIIGDVRKGKDRAVIEYTRRFDRVDLRSLEVTREEIDRAKQQVSREFLEILEKAAKNIREYHRMQVSTGFQCQFCSGPLVQSGSLAALDKISTNGCNYIICICLKSNFV